MTERALFAPPTSPRSIELIEPGLRRTMREMLAGLWRWPLLLIGGTGTGKTLAACCALDAVVAHYDSWRTQRKGSGAYAELNVLLDVVAAATRWKGGRTLDDVWGQWGRSDIAVLDEVGIHTAVCDSHYAVLKRAIDSRDGARLIVVSNLDVEAIAALYDDRIASRLAGGTVHELTGPDRRLEAAGDRHTMTNVPRSGPPAEGESKGRRQTGEVS